MTKDTARQSNPIAADAAEFFAMVADAGLRPECDLRFKGEPCPYPARWVASIHLHGDSMELAAICDRCRRYLEDLATAITIAKPCAACGKPLRGPGDVIRDVGSV